MHNDLAKAELYLDQALIAPSSDARVAAEAAHEKALLELSKGNPSQALEWAQRAIAAEQGSLRGARHNLAGRIQLALGNWSAADSFARSALVENRSAAQAEEEANSLRIMGIVARNQKKYAEGVFVLQEALKIDKRIGKSVKIAADLEELAKMSRNAGSLKESALYLERSYDVNFSAGRLPQAILNQEALAGIYTLLGDVPKAAKSRDTARKLAVQSKSQQPSGSSVTIKPSSNP